MAEIKKLGHNQNNYGWGTTWSANSRVPIIDKRRFETLAEAQSFVDDISATATATEGLIISVINDTVAKNNGVYYVQKVANTDEKYGAISDKGTLVKVGGSETETANNYSAAVELSKTLVVGQLIKVLSAQTITVEEKELTYQAGFYIVEAAGTISALATSTGSDDEVGALKTRVDALESSKVDKVDGERLMTDAEGTKLAGIAAGAEVNYIKSVGDKLSVDTDGNLTVDLTSKVEKTDYQEKVTELGNAIANKTDYSAHTAHVSDTTLHIQEGERDKWNEVVNKASQSDLNTLSGSVSTLQGVVDTKADASGVTELSGVVEGYKSDLENAISAETSARTEAFNTLSGNIATVSGDVATKASQEAFTAHTNDTDIHVTAELQTKWNNAADKVDTIISGTGVEDVIDTFIDFNNWLKEHGNEVTAMQTAITDNTSSITALTKTVSDNYSDLDGKISGEATERNNAITALTEVVDTKAAQSDLNALSAIVGNKTDKSGVFAELDALAGNVYTKDEADAKYLTGITIDSELNATSENSVQNKVIFAEFGKVRDEITSAVTGDVGAALLNYVKKTDLNTLNDIALYNADGAVKVNISGSTSANVETNKENNTITVSAKVSTTTNNALLIDENGLFVQAITIDGDDVEVLN